MSSLLLGIDIGTASSKGVLVRDDGTVLATATRTHGVSMPHPGWVEHDAEAVWWSEFAQMSQELIRIHPYKIISWGVEEERD